MGQRVETATPDLGGLVDLHRAMARMLADMHSETVTLQTVISQRLELTAQESHAVQHLQNLDRHAQVMSDLSRLLSKLAEDLEKNRVDVEDLKQACLLKSTVDALFGGYGGNLSGRDSGDVMFL